MLGSLAAFKAGGLAMSNSAVTVQDEGHKRVGAAFVTLCMAWVAQAGGIPWWGIAIIIALTYWGLHELAGIKINWWG
jgi:hypothetical protein